MPTLVMTEDYPSVDNPYAMSYVHSRVLEYRAKGMETDVLSFRALKPYNHEGVQVLRPKDVDFSLYRSIASHAPNLRNHAKVLLALKNHRIVFFFHGHEVLRSWGDYPRPYAWIRNRPSLPHLVYDEIKMPLMRWMLQIISKKNSIGTIFVSKWMKERFLENIRMDPGRIGDTHIIPNTSNRVFLDGKYQQNSLLADFITIRPLDVSKYAIDLVVANARANPDLTYHIYGTGRFFEHVEKPPNVTSFQRFIAQADIPRLLNQYRAALLPTRYDAQGVLCCEMASWGIPLISSDISVCKEMLGGFSNVRLLSNEEFDIDIADILKDIPAGGDQKYFHPDKLIAEELEVLNAT